MYEYDPLHIYDEISMFLTISTKMVLVKTCILWVPKNQTGIFPNENPFMKTQINLECVCVCMYLSNPPTILSFTFYLKQCLNKTNLDSSLLLNSSLKVFFSLLTWSKSWSNELDSSWVLDVVLMHKLLNQTVLAPKLDFKSFVEAEHLLRSWS